MKKHIKKVAKHIMTNKKVACEKIIEVIIHDAKKPKKAIHVAKA